jgi:hypothetical protein
MKKKSWADSSSEDEEEPAEPNQRPLDSASIKFVRGIPNETGKPMKQKTASLSLTREGVARVSPPITATGSRGTVRTQKTQPNSMPTDFTNSKTVDGTLWRRTPVVPPTPPTESSKGKSSDSKLDLERSRRGKDNVSSYHDGQVGDLTQGNIASDSRDEKPKSKRGNKSHLDNCDQQGKNGDKKPPTNLRNLGNNDERSKPSRLTKDSSKRSDATNLSSKVSGFSIKYVYDEPNSPSEENKSKGSTIKNPKQGVKKGSQKDRSNSYTGGNVSGTPSKATDPYKEHKAHSKSSKKATGGVHYTAVLSSPPPAVCLEGKTPRQQAVSVGKHSNKSGNGFRVAVVVDEGDTRDFTKSKNGTANRNRKNSADRTGSFDRNS